MDNPERGILAPLVQVLRCLPAPDQPRGGEAATIIEDILGRDMTTAARRNSLLYAVGGKGLFDWGWSAGALAVLDPAADQVRQALLLAPSAGDGS